MRDEIVPGAEWVIAGEGYATRKWDGTCVMIQDGVLYKRYDAKRGKTPPEGFIPAQDPDPKTGHWPGWLKVGDSNADRRHREGYLNLPSHEVWPDGTYELCGPKIGGNPEGFEKHELIKHGIHEHEDCPRSFEALKTWFVSKDIEGIVWHHPDGRMVKIKKSDFGLKRKPEERS